MTCARVAPSATRPTPGWAGRNAYGSSPLLREHRAAVGAGQLLDAARDRVRVEGLLLLLTHDGREHPHAAHREVDRRPERVVVEELLPNGEEDPLRQPGAPVEDRRDGEEVEERAMVRDEEDRVLLAERREVLEAVDLEAPAPAAVDERTHHHAVPVRRERREAGGREEVGEAKGRALETRQRSKLLVGGTHAAVIAALWRPRSLGITRSAAVPCVPGPAHPDGRVRGILCLWIIYRRITAQ
jgi:hypothetical protein